MDDIPSKPSSGGISLFDFLEDKLPAQIESANTNNAHFTNIDGKDKTENYTERHQSRNNEYIQSARGGRY
jgi:hypothetical protein